MGFLKNLNFSSCKCKYYIQIYINRASLVVQMVKNLPTMQETQVRFPGLRRSPEEGNGNPF